MYGLGKTLQLQKNHPFHTSALCCKFYNEILLQSLWFGKFKEIRQTSLHQLATYYCSLLAVQYIGQTFLHQSALKGNSPN